MSQQQNSSNNTNTNGASPSRASADSQPDLPLRTGLHSCTETHQSPSERIPAFEGAFGGPANSEPASSIPSTLRHRPRQSPGESPTFCYRHVPSPVDESPASGGEFLDRPEDSEPASTAADNPPPSLGRRSLSTRVLPSPDTIGAVAGAFGLAVGHSAPGSPSPAAVDQRLRDYFRARSMSCPELLGYDLCTPVVYADLNPNGDCAEYLDFAGYCAFVEVLRVTCSHGPELTHASREQLYGQPGSYSPVRGFGSHGAGIFHEPGCYGHAFMYSPSQSSSISPRTQQSDRELLEPRQFIKLFLPRRLPHQQVKAECSCSACRDLIRGPGSPPQQRDPEDFEGTGDPEGSE